MKKHEVYEIALKLFGIYLAVSALVWAQGLIATAFSYYYVPTLNDSSFTHPPISLFVIQSIPILVQFIFSWVLISKSAVIGKKLEGKSNEKELTISVSASEIKTIAFIVTGIIIIIFSFKGLAGDIGALQFLSAYGIDLNQFARDEKTTEIWVSLYFGIIKILIGFYLVIGHKRLISLIKKIQG